MSFSASVFKSYDIRGLAPDEIHPDLAYALGRVLSEKYHPKQVVVGRDMRESSPELARALIAGLSEGGAEVTDIGMCSTPVFNFAIGEVEDRYDLGVMVTASHNPHPYNGFKLSLASCVPIGSGSGMEEIRDAVLAFDHLFDSNKEFIPKKDENVIQRYVARIKEKVRLPSEMREISLAIDAGNGMSGVVLPEILKAFPSLNFTKLFWELDGHFPNHEANPLKTETLHDLQKSVLENSCLFGVAFDGDADRVGIVDEKGEQIPGDLLTALLAQEMLTISRGSRVLYDPRSSWTTPEVIREAGGEPALCRVGHAHIKKQMRQEHALFAGELSMHFYFADFSNCESTDFVMLLILKMVLREGRPLSEIWKPLRRYHHSGEMNFHVPSPQKILERASHEYGSLATSVNRLDGLRMEFQDGARPELDWWMSLRASNTEPLLRLNLEAKTITEMTKRKEELSLKIQNWSKE